MANSEQPKNKHLKQPESGNLFASKALNSKDEIDSPIDKTKVDKINASTKASLNNNSKSLTHNTNTETPSKAHSSSDSTSQDNISKVVKSEAKSIAVDVNIAGSIYTVYCPEGDEAELKEATDHINEFINGLRKQSPLLPHENLLVLCCLNLYEQFKQSKQSTEQNNKVTEQANQLVKKMLTDLQTLKTN